MRYLRSDRRNDPFANFDRDFNRTKRAIGAVFIFVIAMKLLFLAVVIYMIFAIASDPTAAVEDAGNLVGSFIGAVERGRQ